MRVGNALGVEREPVRAATSRTAAGATRRASPPVPLVPAGRRRRAGGAPCAGLGADDRGDDAADDLPGARHLSRDDALAADAGALADPGRSPASSLRGSCSACSRSGLTRGLPGVGGRSPWLSSTAGWPASRCSRWRGAVPVQRLEVPLPRAVPYAVCLRRLALAWAGAGARGVRHRRRPRHLLRRLLLGADALHVRGRHGQPGLDAGAGRADGDREERAGRCEAEAADRAGTHRRGGPGPRRARLTAKVPFPCGEAGPTHGRDVHPPLSATPARW